MGWAARANPNASPAAVGLRRTTDQIRRMLALFPDRETYELWLKWRDIPEDARAYYEQFLPARLQTQGSVIDGR